MHHALHVLDASGFKGVIFYYFVADKYDPWNPIAICLILCYFVTDKYVIEGFSCIVSVAQPTNPVRPIQVC